MEKFFLSVSHNGNSKPLLQICRNARENCAPYDRISSIFSLRSFCPEKLENKFYITFCFTKMPFQVLAAAKVFFDGDGHHIFVSHGMASVILIAENRRKMESFLESYKKKILSHEIWRVENSKITVDIIKKHPNTNPEIRNFSWDFPNLNPEIEFISNRLFRTLETCIRCEIDNCFGFVDMLNWFKSYSFCLLYKSLFLEKKITNLELKQRVLEEFPDYGLESLQSEINSLEDISNLSQSRSIRIQQLKDDLYQIAAISSNFFVQAYSGSSPILYSCFEPGEHSLLGVGSALRAVYNLYRSARGAFSHLSNPGELSKRLETTKSPPFPILTNPGGLGAWCDKLPVSSNLDDVSPPTMMSQQAFHIIYFSNRLGFRETKYSISAAVQVLSMCSNPKWSLSTFFHEFTHAHVRSLLSIFYPKKRPNHDLEFDRIYDEYKKRSNPNFQTNSFLDFLKVVFMATACDLFEQNNYNLDGTSKFLNKGDAVKALKLWFVPLNEILVHILDFTYFYGKKADTYTKGIWSSWLVLPFTRNRIDEYLLRNISAIASNLDGNENSVFDNAVKEIKQSLVELKDCYIPNNPILDVVLERLNNPGEIKTTFFRLFVIINTTAKLLVSDRVLGEIADTDEALQRDGSYSLELKIGEFEERDIRSPITYLFGFYDQVLSEKEPLLVGEKLESLNVWFLTLLSSSQ